MSALRDVVRRGITRHGLCPPGTRLLVALSGGSDSVGLLWLMQELARGGGYAIAGLAHFNHQLRPAAARDEAFCRALAARIGCPIDVGTADVQRLASEGRVSLEEAARRERYAFLHAAAERAGADRIATGHTRDDQTETFLLKLARGAGLTGLGGIYPVRGLLVRPLLDVTRSELQAYLRELGEPWVDDETNADITNPRNRVRHVLLPQLDAAFGASVRETIARAAALAGEDGQWLDAVAAGQFDALAIQGAGGVEFERAALRVLPRPVLRRTLLLAMRQRAGGREVGLRHVEAALEVLAGRAGRADGPWGRWELLGEKLVLVDRDLRPASPVLPFSYPLEVPGEVLIPEADCRIVAERLSSAVAAGKVGDRVVAMAGARFGRDDSALVSQSGTNRLVVRSRRPGDRLRLAGAPGRKKLQDVFVDAKLPLGRRDRIPLVVDAADRIVWVPGYAVSADFRVNAGEDAVILLKFTRMGEKA